MMVLVLQSCGKMAKCYSTPVQHYCSGLAIIDHANLVTSFNDPIYLPKIQN